MHDPTTFDDFYADARSRLLVQTFALSGDLDSAQRAVEDAFVVAWHHWGRVARRPDREAWVRRLAWRHVAWRPRQRRRGRRAGRDRDDLGPEVAATLAALGTLTPRQRRILVLDQSTRLSLPQIAGEVGVGPERAEAELAEALAAVRAEPAADDEGDDEADGPAIPLENRRMAFARAVTGAPWPAPVVLRRAGAARRRSHTVVGVLATTLALVVSGIAVTQPGGARPSLASEELTIGAPAVQIREPAPAPASLLPSELLVPAQLARLDRGAQWLAATTDENTAGTGLVLPCQQARFAATSGVGALVRRFATRPRPGEPTLSAVQMTELTRSRGAARAAYRQAISWYAACNRPRAQLLTTQSVDGVGTAATLFAVRTWDSPVSTLTVAVARSGRAITTVARLTEDRAAPTLPPVARLLAAAVNGLCGSAAAARCASPPGLAEEAPLPVGPVAGMLEVVDLPPVPGLEVPWVATRPEGAAVNAAATRCDETVFTDRPITRARTRSFLVTEAELSDLFGLTQTVGVLPSREAAVAFVEQVRERLTTCEDGDLGTEVERLFPTTGAFVTPPVAEGTDDEDPTASASPTDGASPSEEASPTEDASPSEEASPTDEETPADGASPDAEESVPEELAPDEPGNASSVALWQVTTEISDEQTVRFLMAVVRAGRVVSQIGFIPVDGADIGAPGFARLVDRAVERLPAYAARSRSVG